MSIYTGKVKKERLKGEVTKIPGVKARVSNHKGIIAEIFPIPKYAGKFYGVTSFSGSMKLRNLMYRFLSAKKRMLLGRKSKANSAPAVDVKIDSAFHESKEAIVSTHPAKGISVDQKERVSVFANLSAYIRAGCVYIKQLFLKSTAKLQSAHGVLAKYTTAVKLKLTSKAIAAKAEFIISLFNKVQAGKEAAGSSAHAHIVPATESTLTEEYTATASTATVADAVSNNSIRLLHRAPIASWCLPDQDGNILQFFQVFSGVQSGNMLEIDFEKDSVYWANAKATDGTLNLVFAQTEPQTDNELKVI